MGCLGDEGLNWGSWEVEAEAEWVRIIAGGERWSQQQRSLGGQPCFLGADLRSRCR